MAKRKKEEWTVLTKRIPGAQEFRLVGRKSTTSDFVDYYAFLHYQTALKKLGTIEEFELRVKMPVLDYISELHAERMELKRKATPRKALRSTAGPMCPNHCHLILNTAMDYCPMCGQAIKWEVINNA